MKYQSELNTKKLFLHIILLVLWNIVGAYVLINYAPPTLFMLGMALNVFVIVFALTELFPYSSWVSLIVATGVYAGVGYSIQSNQREFLVSAVIGTAVFLITAIICNIYAHVVGKIDQKYASLQQIADSLVIYDESTSLMRWKFAKQTLITEIFRGRRYHNDVTLVIFDYRQRDQLSQEGLQAINKVVAKVLLDGIRTNLDIAFINDHPGLILPETDDKGALILTQRLVQKINRQGDVQAVAGIASFPQDAITEDEIVLQAKKALQVTLGSDQSVATYHSMSSDNPEEAIQEAPSSPEPSEEPQQQEAVNILESITLDDDQCVVWIEGFDKMDDFSVIEESLKEIEHIQGVEFLFLQENHLVIKVRSSLKDLIHDPNPFPGWMVVKTSPENRYLLIRKAPEAA
jgi:hypothetical protein